MKTNHIQGTWCTLPDGPASCYRTQDTLLGVLLLGSLLGLQSSDRAGRLRLGVGPGQGGRAGTFPDDPPGPALWDRQVSRGPVEAEGGLGGERYGSGLCPEREEGKD